MSAGILMVLRKGDVHPGRCWQGGDRRALWGQVGGIRMGRRNERKGCA